MTRTQVAIFVCSLYAVIGVFVGGGLRPMLMLAVITCGPLALHYLTNPAVKGLPMAELALIRTAQGLVPATEADREVTQKWKLGQVVHGKFTKMRNAKFHGKFFSMLDLAWEYWEPVGGLVPRQEMRGIRGLAKFFEVASGKAGQLSNAVEAYIAQLEADRAERFPAVDKSREAFREWVTIEAGHFHLVRTPDGVRKEAKSISWAYMDDTAFEPLYRDVFNACWRLVLSAHFESEEAALSAADQIGSYA